MKKIIGILFLVIIVLLLFSYKSEVIIPEYAIRFRVIANSDSDYDQEIKNIVRLELEQEISKRLNEVDDVDTAKSILQNTIPEFERLVKKTLEDNSVNMNFTVNYGYNYFPEKKYKGVTYKAGKYESLVVTLGEGKGSNWWCVMFPPLCLVEAEENYNSDNTEYRFFVKDLIDKYF